MCQQTEQREAGRTAALTHAIRMPRTDRAAATSAHTFVLLFYIQLILWLRTVSAFVHTVLLYTRTNVNSWVFSVSLAREKGVVSFEVNINDSHPLYDKTERRQLHWEQLHM